MTAERYALLGLAHARAPWFRSVSQWANAASLPADFVKCVSAEELRARLGTGRRWSAVLVDASIPAVDRDLVDAARAAGAAVLVVDDGRASRDWRAIEVSAVLTAGFGRDDLQSALVEHTRPVSAAEVLPSIAPVAAVSQTTAGRLVAVLGPGGTGTSTVAIAIAQAAADRARFSRVVLADMKRHAEQAVLHDAHERVPGVQELVDAHRAAVPNLDAVQAMTFHVVERGYDLLLGLRRARFWASLRPRAVAAAVDSLRSAYATVVCDTDADLEGESDSGAMEVEERNALSRTVVGAADAVVVIGDATFKGVHALTRTVDDVARFGTPIARVVPVINRAPRGRGQRSVAAALRDLAEGTAPPVFVPERRGIVDALHDGVRLPDGIGAPVLAAVDAVVDWAALRTDHLDEPEPVRPGSLGTW